MGSASRKLKRQKLQIFSSQPLVGSDIRANYKTAYSVYLLSDDPEIINDIVNSVFLFVCLCYLFIYLIYLCERFEAGSHFKSRLSLIVRVNVVLNRTVVVDSD